MCHSKPSNTHHNDVYSKFELDTEYQIGHGERFQGLIKQQIHHRRARSKDVNQYSAASSSVNFHDEDSDDNYPDHIEEAENIVHSVCDSSDSGSTLLTDCTWNDIEKSTEDEIEDTVKIAYSEFKDRCSGVSKIIVSNNDYYFSDSKEDQKGSNKQKKTKIYKTKRHNTKKCITRTRNSHYGSTRKTRKENWRPRPEIEKVKAPRHSVCALSEYFIRSQDSAFAMRSKEAWKRRKKKRRSSNCRNMKGWQSSIKEVWKRRKRKKRSSRCGNIEAWQRRKKKYNIQNCAGSSRAMLTEGINTPEACLTC